MARHTWLQNTDCTTLVEPWARHVRHWSGSMPVEARFSWALARTAATSLLPLAPSAELDMAASFCLHRL